MSEQRLYLYFLKMFYPLNNIHTFTHSTYVS